MEKLRIKYGSIAWMIEKFIVEHDQPGGRQLGLSRRYTLRMLQRSAIGGIQYDALTPLDIINHCKMRKASGIQPQTINQDSTYLSGVLKHAVEVWEMGEAPLAVYIKAKAQLKRQQLICKSVARTRRPTPEEFASLLALAAEDDQRPKNKILMVPIIKFQGIAARRISETCRLTRKDVDVIKRICLVRDLKNPKGKGFHDWFPLLEGAWEIVEQRLKEIPEGPDERLFPYNAKSIEARFTKMKHKLGIKNLRLHDLRRESISKLFEQGFSVPQVAKVSLHRNPTQLLGTYTSLPPEDLHKGPAGNRTVH